MKDPYKILGVARTAGPEEIKKSYRALAHRYHPDKNPDDSLAEERFKEAQAAYDLLSDPQKRKEYDHLGRFGQSASSSRPQSPDNAGGFGQNFGDLFGDLFGEFFSNRNKSVRSRGEDRRYTLEIDFVRASLGGEEVIRVPRAHSCVTCNATGAKPGSSPQLCHACGGSGQVGVQQGLFTVNKTCTYCSGRGKLIADPCVDCAGQGLQEKKVNLKVRIPPGTESGTTLRYAGEGYPGKAGGADGDLRVVLKVKAHPFFKRDGADLYCELPLTIVEAALGTEVDIPTLDGKVKMKVPPGTQGGKIFRLKGKGVKKLSSTSRGDQHVEIKILTPIKLDAQSRAALENLRMLNDEEHYPERLEFRKHLK